MPISRVFLKELSELPLTGVQEHLKAHPADAATFVRTFSIYQVAQGTIASRIADRALTPMGRDYEATLLSIIRAGKLPSDTAQKIQKFALFELNSREDVLAILANLREMREESAGKRPSSLDL